MRVALAWCPGPILLLIAKSDAPGRYVVERHVCVDTTAAGGNASLLAEAEAYRPRDGLASKLGV